MQKLIPPPPGHATWLDYAVSTMDTRSAYLAACGLFDDDVSGTPPDREDMIASANAELAARNQAAAQQIAIFLRQIAGTDWSKNELCELADAVESGGRKVTFYQDH